MSARELLQQYAPMFYSGDGSFHGHQHRTCGDHRTVGKHRAWCYDCAEWCYPSSPCVRCERPTRDQLEAAVVAALDYADTLIGCARGVKHPERAVVKADVAADLLRSAIVKALRGEA